jgi:putative GTP pyrophosphokinase
VVDLEKLSDEYRELSSAAEALRLEVVRQLQMVLDSAEVSPGFPIQSRVKSWPSISAKIESGTVKLKRLSELRDLVGVRAVFLYKRDLARARTYIKGAFSVEKEIDTSDRLQTSTLGYQSIHLVLRIPDSWTDVPSLTGLARLQVELQLRTMAQHIWAEASRRLQYKASEGVPQHLQRDINRVSAVLELVDLEFERVLAGRDAHRSKDLVADPRRPIDVDVLETLQQAIWPEENRSSSETEMLAVLLQEVRAEGIRTAGELKAVLEMHRDRVVAEDREYAGEVAGYREVDADTRARARRGVYLTHAGLTRSALNLYDNEASNG